MKKLGITIFAITALVLGSATAMFTSTQVSAQSEESKQAVCRGVAITGGDCDDAGESEISKVIQVAINLFSMLVGVAAVIMVIIGGFKYITSSGDSAGVNSAKNTILFAIIGLVIVAMAQIIVRFVLGKV